MGRSRNKVQVTRTSGNRRGHMSVLKSLNLIVFQRTWGSLKLDPGPRIREAEVVPGKGEQLQSSNPIEESLIESTKMENGHEGQFWEIYFSLAKSILYKAW